MFSLTFRQTAVLVLVFILTSSALIVLDQQHKLDPLKGSADQVVGPLAASFSRLERRLTQIGGADASGTAKQVAEITAERDQLLAENARLKQLEQEVAQLRDQLGFKNAHAELKVAPANVIGRDPEGTHQYIVIDRGSNDGIAVGMAVVSPNFFIGQVTQVEPTRARVTLAIDASFQVAAMLENSRADGILFGRWQSGGRMELRYLDPKTQVGEGDVVVTSGKTARVPEGLVIGKVYGIDRNVQADTLTVQVTPLIDFNGLQSVSVILGGGQPE